MVVMPERFNNVPLPAARVLAAAIYQHHKQYSWNNYTNLDVVSWGDTPQGFQFWQKWAELLPYQIGDIGFELEFTEDFDPKILNRIIQLQKEIV